jgi:hypothetical protein
MHRDKNDLQKKTVTKDELQWMMDGFKREIMEGLKNFLTERTPESENVSHEIHDEDTQNMIQVGVDDHPPFPTGSKQFSDNFGNLLFLVVLTSGAILRA